MRTWPRRQLAKLVLVTFVAALALPLVSRDHLQDSDDADCGWGSLVVRDRTPHVTVPVAPTDTGHCAICHWLQSIRSAAASKVAAVTPQASPSPVAGPEATRSLAGAAADHRPSRAPPSLG
jgi:hypothetical protein